MKEGEKSNNLYQRLLAVQGEVIVPRQESRFRGGSRSAEQILEAIKPICRKHGLLVHTTEEVELIGTRNRIKATATVINVENPDEQLSSTASAWEGEISSGLDASQVSGKTGSYAKKYALQHLFSIDDTKDADFEHHDETKASGTREVSRTTKEPASDLTKAKRDINSWLQEQGYTTVALKRSFIEKTLGHDTIDNLDEAHLIADALGVSNYVK